MTKYSLCLQLKTPLLVSTVIKSFSLWCHEATFFMHIPVIFGVFFQQRHKITHEISLGTQIHKIISGLHFSFICLCFL